MFLIDKALFNSRALDLASSLCTGSCSVLLCYLAFMIVLLLLLFFFILKQELKMPNGNAKP